jgi:hypothetical protein
LIVFGEEKTNRKGARDARREKEKHHPSVPCAPCALAVLFLLSCSSATPLPPPPIPVPTASAPASASAAPPAESPRKRDPRWIQAASDDPLEKARLAVAVGAAALLDGVADGGETAEIALAALPFADDGEAALGPLADRARGDAAARGRILAAILGIAGQPRRQREAIDPEGARRCAEVLVALAKDASVPREERALAVSAARALAERGFVDRARIPSELDPETRKER